MGNNNNKYIKTFEEKVETCVKKGLRLKEIQLKLSFTENSELFNIIFEPNKWNIFHIACWYGNLELLKDLISQNNFNKSLIDQPDMNGEPPVTLSCVLDDVNVLKFMIEEAKCKTDFKNINDTINYRQDLSIQKCCVIHDSIKCFLYLNPDLNIEDDNLDYLYDLAKNKVSENISKAFEKTKIEYSNFDYDLFCENEPYKITL